MNAQPNPGGARGPILRWLARATLVGAIVGLGVVVAQPVEYELELYHWAVPVSFGLAVVGIGATWWGRSKTSLIPRWLTVLTAVLSLFVAWGWFAYVFFR